MTSKCYASHWAPCSRASSYYLNEAVAPGSEFQSDSVCGGGGVGGRITHSGTVRGDYHHDKNAFGHHRMRVLFCVSFASILLFIVTGRR